MSMRFTIVTPSYNSERFIGETIESVINQKGDFSIEYVIVDNCSTDDTIAIVNEYIDLLKSGKMAIKSNYVRIKFISEKDSGMYEAIQKGFDQATGDIFAWINSDDIYLPGAFDFVHKTFKRYSQIMWLKGITSYINKNSTMYTVGRCWLYQQDWISNGLYGPTLQFIQQDSVFWRSDLWHLSGGIDSCYSVAGDFSLWRKFAEIEPLYSLNVYVSCFRKISGQISEDIKAYWQEVNDYDRIKLKYKSVKRYFDLEPIIPRCLRPLCYRLISGKQQYHLVTLENNIEPLLREGGYYELRKLL